METKKKILLIGIIILILMGSATLNANMMCKSSYKTNVTHISFDKSCDDNKLNDVLIGFDIIQDIFKRNF